MGVFDSRESENKDKKTHPVDLGLFSGKITDEEMRGIRASWNEHVPTDREMANWRKESEVAQVVEEVYDEIYDTIEEAQEDD